MPERPADWSPVVSEVPEVREHLELLFEALANDDIQAAAAAFVHLIGLADRREEGTVKDAARRALLRLAARYPPDALLGARLVKNRSAGGGAPMEGEERYSVMMALLIAVFMKDSDPSARA